MPPGARPKRAAACEATLQGAAWYPDVIERACAALAEDFTPLSDWRASSEYRMLAAQNLLRRYFHDLSGVPVSVLEVAP